LHPNSSTEIKIEKFQQNDRYNERRFEDMTGSHTLEKIDIFTHVLLPRYKEALDKKAKYTFYNELNNLAPTLSNLDDRFQIMDRYEGLKQVLTIASPPLEMVFDVSSAIELAKIANDEMAEIVVRYPDRFAGAVACLPMNNIDAALVETDRAIKDLNFKGVQIYTPANSKPLDSPEFMDLYMKMCNYNLPIWIHPVRDRTNPDYAGESHSRHAVFQSIGWPYETTVAMCRLVFSGVLDKYPDIKFITHHCGAMLPFFAQRIGSSRRKWLSKSPIEYFKMFYGDTAVHGSLPAIMCGHAFFGTDHLVFGTDMPYVGVEVIDQTLDAIDSMDISDSKKKQIFKSNAQKLLGLAE
jgi:aminocarboxymuconate-semialdehyde decarboxylase